MNLVTVVKYFTATNTDALSGTELDPPPRDGVIVVTAFSDNVTATLEIAQAHHQAGKTNIIPYSGTNADIKMEAGVPFRLPVKAGQRPAVVIGGTVSKVHLVAQFYPA